MALPFECKRRSQLSTCSLVPSPPSCSRKRVVTNPTFRRLRYLLAYSFISREVLSLYLQRAHGDLHREPIFLCASDSL